MGVRPAKSGPSLGQGRCLVRLNADILKARDQPRDLTKDLEGRCLFGTQSVSLALDYQAVVKRNAVLQARVEEADAGVESALKTLVENCPSQDDGPYADVTNKAMAWNTNNIRPAVIWAKNVVAYCEPLSKYSGDIPDRFRGMVKPYEDAIEDGDALAKKIAKLLPDLLEKRNAFDRADKAAFEAEVKRCETLGDRAEALELPWKRCMSDADLSMTARQYSATDDELYIDYMEKKNLACAQKVGLAKALKKYMIQCEDSYCEDENLSEIDHYAGDGDYDLYACASLFPEQYDDSW
jgi:hypothetical protein